VRLRLLIETVLQKLFAVKLNLMSANLGVVFMRRPNRPHREPNEYDYQNYIWKDLAQRILKKDEHTASNSIRLYIRSYSYIVATNVSSAL